MRVDRDPDRSRTIRRLLRLGMPLEAAAAAVDDDRVMLTLLDHLLAGPRVLTREDAAARAGIDPGIAEALDRLGGVPPGRRVAESEVRHLALIGRLLQHLPAEAVIDQLRHDLPMIRTIALRTLDIAEAQFLADAREALPDDIDLAVALHEAAQPLLDITTELIGQSYRRVVLTLLTSDLMAEALREGSETVDVAVGFVDVVGYTSLSARVDPRGLGEVLTAFEHACLAMAESTTRVQLVKFLGDAAMFVSLDPVDLAGGLHDLVQQVEQDDALGTAPIRGGMAAGPALLRGGDYFGAPVNEAARLTDLARRGSVLVSDDLRDVLDPVFRLRRIRPVRLHGIGVRRPSVLKGWRADDEGA